MSWNYEQTGAEIQPATSKRKKQSGTREDGLTDVACMTLTT